MRNSIVCKSNIWVNHLVTIYRLKQQLYDLALHFETSHVFVVCHYTQGVADALREEMLVEDCRHLGII
jgi:hypothetical protein